MIFYTRQEHFPTEDIKSKLRSTRLLAPDLEASIHDFASYMADTLGERTRPHGFIIAGLEAIADCQKGVHSRKNQPLPLSLTNQAPAYYRLLSPYIPILADLSCPEKFATEVQQVYDSATKGINRGGRDPPNITGLMTV